MKRAAALPAHHYRGTIDGVVCNIRPELVRCKDGHVSLRVTCTPAIRNPPTDEALHEYLLDLAPWGCQS